MPARAVALRSRHSIGSDVFPEKGRSVARSVPDSAATAGASTRRRRDQHARTRHQESDWSGRGGCGEFFWIGNPARKSVSSGKSAHPWCGRGHTGRTHCSLSHPRLMSMTSRANTAFFMTDTRTLACLPLLPAQGTRPPCFLPPSAHSCHSDESRARQDPRCVHKTRRVQVIKWEYRGIRLGTSSDEDRSRVGGIKSLDEITQCKL